MLVLCTFTMLCGIAQFVLVFLSLRLLFPRQLDTPLIGLAMTAFLQMQFYLSHYVTNETLAATLASAAVYFTLRLLKMDDAPMSIYAWIGLLMGATILTKATGLLLAPAVMTALVFNVIKKKAPLADESRSTAAIVTEQVRNQLARLGKSLSGTIARETAEFMRTQEILKDEDFKKLSKPADVKNCPSRVTALKNAC